MNYQNMKLKNGISYTVIMMVINIIYALYYFFDIEMQSIEISNAVLEFTYVYCNVSIWVLIRRVFINKYNQVKLAPYLLRFIKLLAIVGLLNVISLFVNQPLIKGVSVILSIVMIVLVILIAILIWRIHPNEMSTVGYIKNYISVEILVGILSAIIILTNEYRFYFMDSESMNIEFVAFILNIIPLLFLILFFRKEIKMPM